MCLRSPARDPRTFGIYGGPCAVVTAGSVALQRVSWKARESLLQVSCSVLHLLAPSLDEIDIPHLQGGEQRDSAAF